MTRLGILLIAATMTWQQVTPTDQNGCAGFVPDNYDKPNLSSRSQIRTIPVPPPSNNPSSDNGHHYGNDKPDNHRDKGHSYDNNSDYDQFNPPNNGGNSW